MTVAVVDDDHRVLESMQDLLEAFGYRALLYATAEEFLESPERDSVDCLISDIGLPGMSGLDLMRVMRGESRSLPTILITARTEAHLEREAAELEPLRYFLKPFDAAQLLATLEALQTARRSHC